MSFASAEGRVVSDAAAKTRNRWSLAWRKSVWLGLAVSLVVGLIYALVLLGPAPLNPRNIGWLGWDPATYYITWELFRHDPHWHWPLTYTNWLGYPAGASIALADPNPVLALVFKPLSTMLPEPFQYFGIEAALACALPFFFAVQIFRLVLGSNPLGIGLCSLFFLIAPPLTWRLTQHFSLTNHWLLLAAVLVYSQAQQEQSGVIRQFVISVLVLTATAVAINPYLAFQVGLVLSAAVVALVWQRRLPLSKALAFMTALGMTGAIVAYSLGLVITGSKVTLPGVIVPFR